MPAPFQVANVLERTAWTFAQAFLGAWAVTSTITVDQARASALAGVAAGISAVFTLVKSLLLDSKPKPTGPLGNIVHRVLWTFAAAAAGILPVTLTVDSAEALLKSALGAGAAAVVALAKNLSLEGVLIQAALRANVATEPNDLP